MLLEEQEPGLLVQENGRLDDVEVDVVGVTSPPISAVAPAICEGPHCRISRRAAGRFPDA